MATKKSNPSAKSTKTKTTKSKSAAKPVKKSEVVAPKTKTVEKKTNKTCLAGFFAKKYEAKESILTIFKSHKFYGALLGEVIGTMLLALFYDGLSSGASSPFLLHGIDLAPSSNSTFPAYVFHSSGKYLCHGQLVEFTAA